MALSRGESSIPEYRSKYSERERGGRTAGAGVLGSGAEASDCVVSGGGDDGATSGGDNGALGHGVTEGSTGLRPAASSIEEHDAKPRSPAPKASPKKKVLHLIRFTWILMEKAIGTPGSGRRALRGGSDCSKGVGPA
jgi:hypothetical protein